MSNYMFIDGNNLACRAAFANPSLKIDLIDFSSDFNPDDAMDDDKTFPTGAIHGFMRSIATLRRNHPDFYIAVVWDSGYRRRLEKSTVAMNEGVVPEPYKANRKRGEIKQELIDMGRQKPYIMDMLSMTDIPQIKVNDEEADDVIASYALKYGSEKVSIYTSDKDFYQLLSENVSIQNDSSAMGQQWLLSKYGVTPRQWVEVGAFQGDTGDNIFGVPGWGEVTAIKYIREHGDAPAVLSHLHWKHDRLREQFADLRGSEFEELRAMEHGSDGKIRAKYPGVQEWMPFTGVALAVEHKKVKMSKTELMALIYEKRILLARDLKGMFLDIPVPELPHWKRANVQIFREACGKFRLKEVDADAETICAPQPQS